MLFASGSSVTVIVKAECELVACGHLSKASTSQREKEKDWRRWQARMQYGIRLLEQALEKVGEHFSVVAWEQQPQRVGRAVGVESASPNITTTRYRPLLSSIQMVNCQYRMSVC